MPALSLQQINNVNIEKPFDLQFSLNMYLWNSVKLPVMLPKPIKLEFDEKIREKINSKLENKKGVYVFMVEPKFPFYPDIKYLVYIGRVMKKNTFFKRFYEYTGAIGNLNCKRNRQLMANLWPQKTFVYFYELGNDADIEIIERELVDKIIPPLNNQFFLKSAQNTRSIYK